MTHRARFCVPNVNMWHFVTTYKDQNKWQKSFWPQYQFAMSKRRIPSFFSQLCLFQTFYSHIYPQNVQFFYMPIQIEFKQKYFNCLLLLRFQISLLPKIFPIKKTAAFCVFCGLRYSSDNLLSFDTNALNFVRPLYT